jgi:hypothetical protein
MSKKLQNFDGPILGISNSLDLFEKLKYDSSNLCKNWDTYDAFNFFVTSWHLFNDWGKSDSPKSISKIKRNRKKLPNEMNLILDSIRDLAIGSKHFTLDSKAAKNRRVDEVHTGNEVGFYEYFFHENLPAITVDINWYFSIRVLHNITMAYFNWVFDDTVSVDKFPEALLETILYCNIPNRKGDPTPEIWLQHISK